MAEYIPERDLRQRARAALSKAKEQSGLKQEALGRRLGVTQASISKALSEQTSQPYATLLAKIIAECEQKIYEGSYHRFSDSNIIVRCQSRTVDDLVFHPGGKDAVLIDYPFAVKRKRNGYLKDIVYDITIRVIFTRTLFAILRNRGVRTMDIVKLAYVDAFHNLLDQLQADSEQGSKEITLYSNDADRLEEIELDKVNIEESHIIDLEFLRQKWEAEKPKRPFGFQLV